MFAKWAVSKLKPLLNSTVSISYLWLISDIASQPQMDDPVLVLQVKTKGASRRVEKAKGEMVRVE